MGCASFQSTVGVSDRATGVVMKMAFDIASHDTTERSTKDLSYLWKLLKSVILTLDRRLHVVLQRRRYQLFRPRAHIRTR